MIDLNSDLGEGAGTEAELLPLLSSANVCCGEHAGSPTIIQHTLRLCATHNVCVGAHPGYADREHFGRRELRLSPDDVYTLVDAQVRSLQAIANACGLVLAYIKPHGGLYHECNRDAATAEAILRVAETHQLALMGLPHSVSAQMALGRVRYIAEGFADRRYRPDGSLVPRTETNAMIDDPVEAVEQVLRLIHEQGIESVCVHGDNPQAVAFVRQIHAEFQRQQISIRPVL